MKIPQNQTSDPNPFADMIPIVLRTWTSNPEQKPILKEQSATEVSFDDKRYTFAAILDSDASDWHKALATEGVLILIGPTGSGKTTTLRQILDDFAAGASATIAACEIFRNDSFVDLIDDKKKRYLSTSPLDGQLARKKLTTEVVTEISSRRLTASTKANSCSSRSCMMVCLKSEDRELTVIDMMGSEKFGAGPDVSNKFANLNNSSITQAILNRTTTKRSSNLVTNLIFGGLKSTKKITFVLHVNLTGDKSLVKSSLENIAEVVRGFRLTKDEPKRSAADVKKLPSYARPTACSMSPRKVSKRQIPTVAEQSKVIKKPRTSVSTPLRPSITQTQTRPISKQPTKPSSLTQKLQQVQNNPIREVPRKAPLIVSTSRKREPIQTQALHKARIAILEKDLEEANTKNAKMQASEAELREEVESKASEIEKLRADLLDGQREINNIKAELANVEQSFKFSTDENEKLQSTLQEQLEILRQKGDDLSARLTEQTTKHQSLEEELQEVKSVLEKVEAEKLVFEESFRSSEGKLVREAALHKDREAHQESQIQKLQSQVKSFQERLERSDSERSSAGVKIEKLTKQLQESRQETEKLNSQQYPQKLADLQARLDAEVAKNQSLTSQLKQQEDLSGHTQNFLQEKVKNLVDERQQLETDLTRFKSKGIEWKKRNEILAKEKNLVEIAECKLRTKVSSLEAKVTDLESYQARCETLEAELKALRESSQIEAKKLKAEAQEYKEKHKRLLQETKFVKPLFSPVEIHEDTTYKAFLKQRRATGEPNSSPLKERNSLERKSYKRHSLQISSKAMT